MRIFAVNQYNKTAGATSGYFGQTTTRWLEVTFHTRLEGYDTAAPR